MRGKILPLAREDGGQVSLMVGMMMMTFILFFAFVVNTGMLISDKINLQNAADLAAYAGAATQARQLNQISYLNYEMRRQYKKFLFRYYVVGNMAQAGFPKTPGAQDAHIWTPNLNVTPYNVPAVCILFESAAGSNDNFCQIQQLPPITIPASNPLDQINQTLIQQLNAIETIRQNNCGAIGNANSTIALLWLLNTDPDLQNIIQQAQSQPGFSPDIQHILSVAQAVAYGIGLLPREIILRQRIKSLQSYVNSAPISATQSQIAQLEKGADPAANERTIQAYLSAYYTLGEHSFDPTSVELDELLPTGGSGANLLNLQDVTQSFDTWSVTYVLANGSAILQNPQGVQAQACQPQLVPVTMTNMPVGVSKDPNVLTYYAVRLKANAQVMFSPFGTMQLTAYAAARPFGSRLGPPVAAASPEFGYKEVMPPSQFLGPMQVGSNLSGYLPNLPVTDDDKPQSGPGWGWDTDLVLGTMYSAFSGGPPDVTGTLGSTTSGAPISLEGFNNALRSAMVPNSGEAGSYNIMTDGGTPDAYVRNFDASYQAAFWAPVIPPPQISEIKDILTQSITDVFQQPGLPPSQTKSNAGQGSLISSMVDGIMSYVDMMQSGNGEIIIPGQNGLPPVTEGFNIARLQDPWVDDQGNPLNLPSVMIGNPQLVKTSYVSTNEQAVTAAGRVGYSVKFISFASLINSQTLSDGLVSPTNTTAFMDEEAQSDVPQIKH